MPLRTCSCQRPQLALRTCTQAYGAQGVGGRAEGGKGWQGAGFGVYRPAGLPYGSMVAVLPRKGFLMKTLSCVLSNKASEPISHCDSRLARARAFSSLMLRDVVSY